jgi:transcriptional regulator with PAS, ATPase and Fis domain
MTVPDWTKEVSVAITILDRQGVILGMNEKAISAFAADGGADLIGKNSLECHPEPARAKLQRLLAEPETNVYTIEKAGVKKLICQTPWYQDGRFSGVVEFSIVLPAEVPHFVRD